MDSLNHHKHKWIFSHSKWTRYIPIISSTINLGQMQTAVIITSSNYLLTKTTWSNFHIKQNFQIGGCILFLCQRNLYFHYFEWLMTPFFIYGITTHFKGHHTDKKWIFTEKKVMDYRHMIFFRTDTHIKYLFEMILFQKHI